jgi:hypothetical protein
MDLITASDVIRALETYLHFDEAPAADGQAPRAAVV